MREGWVSFPVGDPSVDYLVWTRSAMYFCISALAKDGSWHCQEARICAAILYRRISLVSILTFC
jgi:hypothetical protein